MELSEVMRVVGKLANEEAGLYAVQRWLREEKRIDIAIVPIISEAYAYIVYNVLDRDNRVVGTNTGYKTYELALGNALKFVLEKLM